MLHRISDISKYASLQNKAKWKHFRQSPKGVQSHFVKGEWQTELKRWPTWDMCTLDNPASRDFRKDTELWIVQGLLGIAVHQPGSTGSAGLASELDLVRGMNGGDGSREREGMGRKQLQTTLAGVKSHCDRDNCPRGGGDSSSLPIHSTRA